MPPMSYKKEQTHHLLGPLTKNAYAEPYFNKTIKQIQIEDILQMNWPVLFQKCRKGPLVAPAHPTKKNVWGKEIEQKWKEKQRISHEWLLDQNRI